MGGSEHKVVGVLVLVRRRGAMFCFDVSRVRCVR